MFSWASAIGFENVPLWSSIFKPERVLAFIFFSVSMEVIIHVSLQEADAAIIAIVL